MKVCGFACVVLAGCAGGTETDPQPACPVPGAAITVASGYPSGTEGLTTSPDGTLYATSREGYLDVIPVGGAPSHLVALGDPLGATWWKGSVWVAIGEDDLGDPAPAVVEVTPAGVVTRHATPTIDHPNFVAPTPWGTLLVSDDSGDVVYEWRDGDVIPWLDAVPSPNGLAFSPDGATLYSASTFREQGLWATTIDGESAGATTKLVAFEPAQTPDGLAVGTDGSVFVALNLAGEVARWSPDDPDTTSIVATPATPASLVFGRGDRPECELVATSLFGEELTSFGVETPGWFPTWAD